MWEGGKNTPEAEKQRLLVVMKSSPAAPLAHRQLNKFVGHFARRAITSRKVTDWSHSEFPPRGRNTTRRLETTLILPLSPCYFQRNRTAITNVPTGQYELSESTD